MILARSPHCCRRLVYNIPGCMHNHSSTHVRYVYKACALLFRRYLIYFKTIAITVTAWPIIMEGGERIILQNRIYIYISWYNGTLSASEIVGASSLQPRLSISAFVSSAFCTHLVGSLPEAGQMPQFSNGSAWSPSA